MKLTGLLFALTLAGSFSSPAQDTRFNLHEITFSGWHDLATFGIKAGATFCRDSVLGEKNDGGPPPFPGDHLFRWINPHSTELCDGSDCFGCGRVGTATGPAADFRPYLGSSQSDTFQVLVWPDGLGSGYPCILSWSPGMSAVHDSARLTYSGSGGSVAVDMTTETSHVVTDPTVSLLRIVTWGVKSATTPPDPPLLTYPGNGSTIYSLMPMLAWEIAPTAGSYSVQVSTDSLFTSTLHDDTTSDNTFTTGLLKIRTDYFWRVRALNSAGAGGWSETWKLSTPVPGMAGSGTATIDGMIGEQEYAGAATIALTLDLPGGGTVPGTIYVMNDGDNLYLALRYPDQDDALYGSFGVEFQKDMAWMTPGDDGVLINFGPSTATSFYDNFRTFDPPCPPGSGLCGFQDTIAGGTNDGSSAMGTGGGMDMIEASHPLRSGDTGHDFFLSPGDGQGIFVDVVMLNRGFWANSNARENFMVTLPPPVLHAPPDLANGQPRNITLLWRRVFGATSYRLQVSMDPLFGSLLLDDSTLTDTAAVLNDLEYATKYYWRVRSESPSLTSLFSPTRSFTTVGLLAAPVLVLPADGSSLSPGDLTFTWTSVPTASGYRLQLAEDGDFTSIVRDDTIAGDTSSTFELYRYGTSLSWRVHALTSLIKGPWSDTRDVVTAPMDIGVGSRWNLVSVPMAGPEFNASATFPSATTPAYAFNPLSGSYSTEAVLAHGNGYWMKFPANETFSLSGWGVDAETVAVGDGWNLIGSPRLPVAVGSIISDSPGLVTSQFFGYQDGYYQAGTIEPGKAYWVKVSGSGNLILSPGTAANPRHRIIIQLSGEMPPPPPDETTPDGGMPATFELAQNYPNPFNPATTIHYAVPEEAFVTVKVFNVIGNEVETLVTERKGPGSYAVRWDASGVSSGIYYCVMSSGTFSGRMKMVLLK
jgi:hypothetical protein